MGICSDLFKKITKNYPSSCIITQWEIIYDILKRRNMNYIDNVNFFNELLFIIIIIAIIIII